MLRNIVIFCFLSTIAFPAFTQGFDESYEIRIGAFTGGAANDLYISQIPEIVLIPGDIVIPVALPAPVEDFVLENNGDGTFSLIDDLTLTQRSNVSSWPEAAIDLSLGDFNADGYVDLFLEDVGSVLTGVYDQMVFAQMDEQVAPQAVTAVTPDVEQFFEDIVGWLMDENYFENTAYANNWYNIIHGSNFWAYWKTSYLQAWGATYGGIPLMGITEDPYNQAVQPAACNVLITCVFSNGQWYMWGGFHTHSIEYDYSNFDQDALGIISSGSLSNITNSGELVAGSVDAVAIANVFANILGVPYMGGVLAQTNGSLLDSEEGLIGELLRRYRVLSELSSLVDLAKKMDKISDITLFLNRNCILLLGFSNAYSYQQNGTYLSTFESERFSDWCWGDGSDYELSQSEYSAIVNATPAPILIDGDNGNWSLGVWAGYNFIDGDDYVNFAIGKGKIFYPGSTVDPSNTIGFTDCYDFNENFNGVIPENIKQFLFSKFGKIYGGAEDYFISHGQFTYTYNEPCSSGNGTY